MAGKGGNKTLFRGILLLVSGMLLGSLGNYMYANKSALKTFLLNVKRQIPDLRDYLIDSIFAPIDESINPLPPTVDLRANCPPIYNQGSLGSCVSNAGCAARIMLSDLKINLSRLYHYYNVRFIEGNVNQDSGGQLRDIGKAFQQYGVCEEPYFPYVVSNYANTPTENAKANAEKYKIKGYYSINTLTQVRQTLLQSKKPILAAMEVYDSFSETPSSGIMSMPKGDYLGNHAILIVGYSDEGQYLICRNSWGEGFALKGYFFMPYDYVKQNYAFDFWYLDA